MSFSPKMSLVKATPRCQRIGCGRLFIYNVDPAIAYRQREETMKDIDEYEAFLTSKLEAWSPEQRVAFAAAMVERWLHTYEKFSADEQLGDAVNLRRILDAVWGHVLARPLSPADRARYTAQLQESTPHLDDFDANEAMATCVIL